MTHLHKILVVGTGSIGERHVRCFLVTGRATVAICEPNAAIRQIVNDRYDIRNDYGNLEEAMASRFDAAVIATPAPLHIPQAMVLARQPFTDRKTIESGSNRHRRVAKNHRNQSPGCWHRL